MPTKVFNGVNNELAAFDLGTQEMKALHASIALTDVDGKPINIFAEPARLNVGAQSKFWNT